MSLLTRLLGLERKDDNLPIVSPVQSNYYNWPTNLAASWTDVTPATLAEYYIQNPIVHACIRVYADAFAQARMKAYKPDTDEEIEGHPALELLRRPNNIMGQSEFWRYTATYALFGGNSYTHIVGNRGGLPGELWPYSAVQIVTVPSPQRWVDRYAYNLGSGQWKDIPPSEIIHVKWAVDPERPWQGLAPMRSSARAIDTHNEFTRLRKVLLENDAIPRTALRRDKDAVTLTDTQRAGIRQDFRRLFAGDQAGSLAILEGGADLVRLALNMDEIQASELTAQLEADICASFGVHPIIAKVKLGLDKSTYSNYAEAVEDFTKSNLVPLWESVASEFTNGLQPFFGDGFELKFDLSKVQALQEDQNALSTRVTLEYEKGVIVLDEARGVLGYPPSEPEEEAASTIDKMQVRLAAQVGIYTANEAREEFGLPPIEGGDVPLPVLLAAAQSAQEASQAPEAPEAAEQDIPTADEDQPEEPVSEALEKMLTTLEGKAQSRRQEAIQKRIEARMSQTLERIYKDAADHVEK